MPKIVFNNKDNSFFTSLKKDVDTYFETNKIDKTGDWRLYSKTFILWGGAIGLYFSIMFLNLGFAANFGMSILLGLFAAGIGFSVMHDANHGSYSNNSLLNDFIGLSANGLGASAYFWKQKHNIIHHTYTNVDGIDDDIAKSPIIRQCESQKWVPAHKIQHLYLTPIYALSTLFWIFSMDFKKYFSRKIYTTDAWKLSTTNHVIFWVTKIYYVTVFMILPIATFGFWGWLACYLIGNASLGITLSFVFQLAHVVENTEFETIALDETKHIETAWAEHQIRTTANFSMDNKFISWYVGGLNYQIEHHLFPKVSHIHYPVLSKFVQAKCKEYNLPYHNNPTFFGAVASHFRVMKSLGKPPIEINAELNYAA